MRCDHCGQKATRTTDKKTGLGVIESFQIVASGPDYIRFTCWNCGKENLVLKKGSKLNEDFQRIRKERIQQYKRDLVNKTRKDGVAWEGSDGD